MPKGVTILRGRKTYQLLVADLHKIIYKSKRQKPAIPDFEVKTSESPSFDKHI